MTKPKNLIIEEVPNKTMRDFFGSLLENDIPLYYTRHPRAVPHAANVFDFDTVKIFVAPDRKQEQYIDKRIIDLYDDLSPDLRTVAERLSTETTDDAARILRDILTQYDAKETADYLQSSLRDGMLCNYSEVVPKEHYESRDGRIETYAFYLKGILTSFGITVERDEGCYCLLYDEDSDYSHALSFFAENIRNEDGGLYRRFREEQSQM